MTRLTLALLAAGAALVVVRCCKELADQTRADEAGFRAVWAPVEAQRYTNRRWN